MDMHPNDRVVLFIDGPNLHATAKSLGFDIDYKKLLAHFRARCRLIRAIYYTTVLEQDEFVSIRPLVDWLEYNGYTLVTKPAKEFVDSLGRRRLKGSMDVELAVDAMRLSAHMDHAVLFTGDGDFRSLVAALQKQGNRVTVVSTLQASSPMIADELRRQADQFFDLADLEHTIARSGPRRQSHASHESFDSREQSEARDADMAGSTDAATRTAIASPSSATSSSPTAVESAADPMMGQSSASIGMRTPIVQHARPRRPRTPTTGSKTDNG